MYTVVTGVGDDHDRALTKARAIADLPASADDLAVVVLHATDATTSDPDTPADDNPAVERVVEFFADRGIETTVETTTADPQSALLDTASAHDAELLCVGGRRHSPAGKVQLRGGAQSVIVNTDRPVLVAGEPSDD